MKTFIKQNSATKQYPIVLLIMIIMVATGSFVFGQTKNKKKECPDKKRTHKNLKSIKKTNTTINKNTNNIFSRSKVVKVRKPKFNFDFDGKNKVGFTEKSIKVHQKAYISLCILRGNIKVNGWDRNEARVFIKGNKRSPIGFKVREKSAKDKKPVWVQVVGYNPKEVVGRNYNTCLSGDIELDIPKNGTIKIQNSKGQSESSVDSVRNAIVEVLGGDIYLNNITDRINANTFRGGVTVRNSSGKMFLSTTTGNIVARNTHSHNIGDYFKAKTRSGAITLQSVEQKEVKSSSNSGSINYVGEIKPYGKYDFSTTNGSINLALPKTTSCQIVLAYGGAFQSELPIKDIFKERNGSLVYLKGKMGNGEANLNLKSFNGTIRIREKKTSVLANF